MAPFDNDDSGWLNTAWSEYTDTDAPWLKISKTARAVLLAPLLAVLLSIANLIEAWTNELLINPLIGIGEFGADFVKVIFRGREFFPDRFGNGTKGLMQALDASWAEILDIVGGLSISALPVAVIFAGALAFLLGRVINRG